MASSSSPQKPSGPGKQPGSPVVSCPPSSFVAAPSCARYSFAASSSTAAFAVAPSEITRAARLAATLRCAWSPPCSSLAGRVVC